MSKCTTEVALRGILTAVIALALPTAAFAQTQSRLATYDSANQTHFALSVTPELANAGSQASDVVIYVDTSASQNGLYKRDSIAMVKQVLRNLSSDDQVKILAIDLAPIALTDGFTSPASVEAAAAVDALNKRTALGTTDVESMLVQATDQFNENAPRNRNVIYIGDGISVDNLFDTPAFEGLVSKLIDSRVSVSSFAIGPEQNVKMMAALANHTGGNVFVDTDVDGSIRETAAALVKTVHGPVLWPTEGKIDESIIEMLPARFPPMRFDRDTIVLGTLANRDELQLSFKGEIAGQMVSMDWNFIPENHDEQFAFLPGMIRDARNDRGLRLPTVGSTGLREFARWRAEKSLNLSDLAQKALAAGDVYAAERLGQGALVNSVNPAKTRDSLIALQDLAPQKDDPFGELPATDGFIEPAPAAPQQSANTPAPPTVVPGSSTVITPPLLENPGGIFLEGPAEDESSEVEELLRSTSGQTLEVLQSVEDQQRVINERARARVRFEIEQASGELNSAPDIAIERLKGTLETIRLSADLYEANRAELSLELESSLLSARRRKLEYDEALARSNQNLAIAAELADRSLRIERDEDRLASLVNNFNSLLLERAYEEAVGVTEKAFEIAPNNPAVTASAEYGRIARNYDQAIKLRRLKQENFTLAMFAAIKAGTPYPGDTLMIFPDADEWNEKVKRRDKFQNFRLAGSDSEETILKALEEPAEFNYEDNSWTEVKEDLESRYGFNIVLTTSASEDSLDETETFTSTLSGIRLKNALRILLAEKNATFVIKDDVMQIISKDDEQDAQWFTTEVYNVADLVAPRQNFGGGGGGFGGGGGGGFGGGGGGGFGGGGGGRGGGGFGGGGFGGGGFCIQNNTVDVNYANVQPPKTDIKRQPKPVNLNDDGKPTIAWTDFFADAFANQGDVRATVRRLMKDDQPREVVALIMAAVDNNQLQSWMYEALVLAMQVAGENQAQVERALMSAVDLTTEPDDVLLAANYMAANGMEVRSLKLLRSFARSNPTRFEPYVLGLRTAQAINDVQAMKWATIGIAEQEWPQHPEMVEKARFVAKGITKSLEGEGKVDELQQYRQQLQAAKERDSYITIQYTGDADLDLAVLEPGGTVCSSRNPRTVSGGIMMGDKFSPGKNHNGIISETYILPKGFAGNYQLSIRRVWGDVTSGKVTVSIHNHYGSDRAVNITKQVKLKKYGALVNFTLDRGRRTENLLDHEIQVQARQRLEADRRAVAQQLRANRSSSAASDYFAGQAEVDGQLGGAGGFNDLFGNRNAVGFMPVIQQIQEGASLTATASTADRLYVLVAPTPQFQQVIEINTFNFLGDADSATGGGGGLGGGGGGGGFGGGGGGGGGGGFGGGGFGGGGF